MCDFVLMGARRPADITEMRKKRYIIRVTNYNFYSVNHYETLYNDFIYDSVHRENSRTILFVQLFIQISMNVVTLTKLTGCLQQIYDIYFYKLG